MDVCPSFPPSFLPSHAQNTSTIFFVHPIYFAIFVVEYQQFRRQRKCFNKSVEWRQDDGVSPLLVTTTAISLPAHYDLPPQVYVLRYYSDTQHFPDKALSCYVAVYGYKNDLTFNFLKFWIESDFKL